MSSLTDSEIQQKLIELTGKPHVVSASTRNVMLKKLAKLESGASGGDKTQVSATKTTQPTKTLPRRSVGAVASSNVAGSSNRSFNQSNNSFDIKDSDTHATLESTGFNESGMSDDDLQEKLFELTGTKFPVTDSTRKSLTTKLAKIEKSGGDTTYKTSPEKKLSSPGRKSGSLYPSLSSQPEPRKPQRVYGLEDSDDSDEPQVVHPVRPNITPPRRSMPLSSTDRGPGDSSSSSISAPLANSTFATTRRSIQSTTTTYSRPGSNKAANDDTDVRRFATPSSRPWSDTTEHKALWYPQNSSSRFDSESDGFRRRPLHPQPSTSAAQTLSSFRATAPTKLKPATSKYQLTPVLLVILVVIVTALIVIGSVLYFKPIPVPLDQVIQPGDYALQLVCDEEHHRDPCFPGELVRQAYTYLQPLKTYLDTHAGYYECGYEGYGNREIVSSRARKDLTQTHGSSLSSCWEVLLLLANKNPHWNMRVAPSEWEKLPSNEVWLQSDDAIKPISCVLLESLAKTLTWMIAVVTMCVLGYIAYRFGISRKQRAKENEMLFEQMKHSVMQDLESQYNKARINLREPKFVPIGHLYDKMVASQSNRAQLEPIWQRLVKFMSTSEPKVRREIHQFSGEEHPVWQFIPAAGFGGFQR